MKGCIMGIAEEINNMFKTSNINKETLTLELYSTVEFCVYVRSMELY